MSGLLLAAVASLLFNTALVLQAVEARRIPAEHGLRLSLLGRLLRRPRWLAGAALSMVAAGVQVLALTSAPLTVVQPADAVGLVLLAIAGARILGEQVGRRELAAAVGIVVGITAVVAAGPARSEAHSGAGGLAVLLVVAPMATVPFLFWRRAGKEGLTVVFGAGFAFAASAFAMKLVADSLTSHAWLSLTVAAGAAVAAGTAGTVSEQAALQQRQATQVAPIIFVTELMVPMLLAVAVGGENWRPVSSR
jgi:drug/metabolite transporter (DMT)-like permease